MLKYFYYCNNIWKDSSVERYFEMTREKNKSKKTPVKPV